MNQHNALATQQQQGLSLSNWDAMRQQAEVLVKSGFLPKDINTPEKAIAVMMTGAELNIPPMQALRQITVIQGKPTVSPELMAALVERDHGSNALIVEESTDKRCVVSCIKKGWDRRREIAFTLEDATRAKLAGSDTWAKYPMAMLRSRAISIACKTYFQASIGGIYSSEELGADVDVVDGEVVVVERLPRETVSARQLSPRLPDVSVDVETGEIVSDEPERGITDLIDDEFDQRSSDTAWAFVVELTELDDARDLAPVKARIKAAGLSDDVDVKSAYNAAYSRLHGVRDTVNTGQPALV